MSAAGLSSEDVVEALMRYVARKACRSSVVTVTARKIARELGVSGDSASLALIGLVLSELEHSGYLKVLRSRRPKRYIVATQHRPNLRDGVFTNLLPALKCEGSML
ncbi:MAG: hypothetical protein QW230_03035 [Thermofilum sp.]